MVGHVSIADERTWLGSIQVIAYNVTYGQLADAAHRTGVALFDPRPANARETAWRFRIVPLPDKDEYGWKLYQRRSTSAFNGERKVHAVCWHGHRDFFASLLRLAPDARIKTAVRTWTAATFTQENLRETFSRNVGAPIMPVMAGEACNCEQYNPVGSVFWNGQYHGSDTDYLYG